MIFIDSNIPMYLVGAPHPRKIEAQILLERSAAAGERLVCDAEVLQEILHRYTAINRREAIGPAIEALLSVVDEVLPVEKQDVLRGAEILRRPEGFSARDAMHIAIIVRHRIGRIMSFDADFDRWQGVARVYSV